MKNGHSFHLISATLFFVSGLFFLWLAGMCAIATFHLHEHAQCVAAVFAGMTLMLAFAMFGAMQDAIDDYRA